MIEKELFAIIGLALTLIGYSAYIYSIFKGETRPHPFSWFVWGILTAIGFLAQISDNAGPGAWVTGLSAVITFYIAYLGYMKRQDIEITRNDWVIFVSTISAIPLWFFTETPLYSVILITVIDAGAFYPTFRKTWFRPEQELAFEHLMAALKFTFAIFALNNYSVITVLYPLSLIIMNVAFLIMQYYRKRALKNA